MSSCAMLAVSMISFVLTSGCGHKEDQYGETGETHTVSLYQENRGLALPEDVKQLIGVELVEVTETNFVRTWTKLGRVFQPAKLDQPALASVVMAADQAQRRYNSQPVQIAGEVEGQVLGFERQLEKALGQVEAIVKFPDPTGRYPVGSFVQIVFSDGSKAASLAIPVSAVIRGAQDDFVYVQSGDHLVRTVVTTAAVAGDLIEITDGLLQGDKVVAKAAQQLWMVELLALRGGDPCCPVSKRDPKR